ncbi:MAG: Ig-like domain-containing protein [Bacteroidales bacterium]|nr:Ig-like domain-containing protein [Bacteroidales bacterium]
MRKILASIIIIAIGFIVYSCANKAQGPTGGPKDETPPVALKSTPVNGAVNFKKKEIQIFFNENISVENVSDNVLISPPQVKQPDVRGNSRILTVRFEEELLDSTTYTINFGNAIVDLNEKNPLKDYRFAFSTGNEIDTLKISGILINAMDLNPLSKTLIGIYRENDDSVFFQKPFLRIGKTDENGHFVIDNVKAGTYKLFALEDINKDYYCQTGEGVAFIDSLVTPTFRMEEMQDTVWEDSIHIDSIRTYMGTRFLPDDLILKFFKESKKRQYLVKSERKLPQSFQLYFNTKLTELPVVKPLNFDWEGKYLLQRNNTLDSLAYWITDSAVYNIDTLQMSLTYLKTDSVYNLVPQTDTLSVFMRKARVNPRARKSEDKPVQASLYKFTSNANGSFEVYNPIYIRFDAPLADVDLSKIKLSEKIDTIFKDLPVKWRQSDSTKMAYAIDYQFEPEKSYELKIDSTAFLSIYNLYSDKFSGQFKVKSLDEYSSIKMLLPTFDSLVVFQVLDTKDIVLASKPALPEGALFEYLKPGDYYMRAFIDSNRNGIWDPGDLHARRQPEEVFYYNKKLSLRANWEFEETWDLRAIPLLQQKPAVLKKDVNKKQGQ